jgi:hypothetical protein
MVFPTKRIGFWSYLSTNGGHGSATVKRHSILHPFVALHPFQSKLLLIFCVIFLDGCRVSRHLNRIGIRRFWGKEFFSNSLHFRLPHFFINTFFCINGQWSLYRPTHFYGLSFGFWYIKLNVKIGLLRTPAFLDTKFPIHPDTIEYALTA